MGKPISKRDNNTPLLLAVSGLCSMRLIGESSDDSRALSQKSSDPSTVGLLSRNYPNSRQSQIGDSRLHKCDVVAIFSAESQLANAEITEANLSRADPCNYQ